MRRLLHPRLRLMGKGLGRELQQARQEMVSQGNGLQQVHARRDAQAGTRHQLNPPQAPRRADGIRIRHRLRQDGIKEATQMKLFELLPRPLGSIFRKLTHFTCNSRKERLRTVRSYGFTR